MRQKERRSARPRENPIARGRAGSRSEMRRQLQQPKKSWRSTGVAELDDSLSRRARLREQRYEEQRRRQWALAIALVVILVIVMALARCNT